MHVHKGTVIEVTAKKLFICQINISKNKSARIKTNNFIVSPDVSVNIFLCFSGIRNMVKAVTFFFCQVAFIIKGRKSNVAAMMNAASVLCEHKSSIE